MFRFTLRVLSVVLFCTCFMYCPDAAADTWQNEVVVNKTLETQNDLHKFLAGRVRVSRWLSSHFTAFGYSYSSGDDITTLTWSSGVVGPGQPVGVCARTDRTQITHRYLPQWTQDGAPFGAAGAALSHEFVENNDTVDLVIGNTATDGGPVTIQTIQVAAVSTIYSIDGLVYDNLDGVTWDETRTDVALALDGSEVFSDYTVPEDGAIVYRATVSLDSDPTNIVKYVGQYIPTVIPAVSEWGLVVMLLLVVAAGTIVIRRRRAAVA